MVVTLLVSRIIGIKREFGAVHLSEAWSSDEYDGASVFSTVFFIFQNSRKKIIFFFSAVFT